MISGRRIGLIPPPRFEAAAMALSNFERYQRIAPLYDLLDSPFETRRYRPLRPLLFDGLCGRILDAGVGTGRNFPYYPAGSTVLGIDLSPAMLRRAERRLPEAGVPVELRQMDVTALDLPDASIDAAVATFLFCVLPDELQVPALRELGRVVKPGGQIRLLEYVRPTGRMRRLLTRLWEPWVAWAYGAGFDRRTEAYVPEAGLELVEARFVFEDLIKLIAARAPALAA
jgi:ubiquinone/menaquinone biosynthesis C-methylase UbiE